MHETIYARPHDYDLEHEGDEVDVAFYRQLLRRFAPGRVLELACGSGRVTIPLARDAALIDTAVVGLELSESMLAEARRKLAAEPATVQRACALAYGDLRTWETPDPFDLIVTPCSSLAHLLSIAEQLAAWRQAWRNLVVGGRFVVDLVMPNLPAYAESMQTPPRTLLEIDVDACDPVSGERMLRYKTTRYAPHEQRASIRFLYDKFAPGGVSDRYVSDFDAHVYFPREVELLFLCTGFEVESVWGGYAFGPLRPSSREIVVVGRKAEA